MQLRANNSATREQIASLRANHIARVTSDFKMGFIKKYIHTYMHTYFIRPEWAFQNKEIINTIYTNKSY